MSILARLRTFGRNLDYGGFLPRADRPPGQRTIIECRDMMRRPFRLMYVTGRLWLRESDSAPFTSPDGAHFYALPSEEEELYYSRQRPL